VGHTCSVGSLRAVWRQGSRAPVVTTTLLQSPFRMNSLVARYGSGRVPARTECTDKRIHQQPVAAYTGSGYCSNFQANPGDLLVSPEDPGSTRND
jgi:hypothetical protein